MGKEKDSYLFILFISGILTVAFIVLIDVLIGVI